MGFEFKSVKLFSENHRFHHCATKELWDWGQWSINTQVQTMKRLTKKQHHSAIMGLTQDTKAISITEKVVHLQNHISPVLPLCTGPILSIAGRSRIRRFVDTKLNRCRQTGRQAKRFTSLCISTGQHTHTHVHNRTGTHSSKWLHYKYAFCPNCDVSSASENNKTVI